MERRFELTFRRVYPAPTEVVFRMWTDVTHVRAWLTCGSGYGTEVRRWDARAGGRLLVELTPRGGGDPVVLDGAFQAVDPPTHLTYEWGPGVVTVRCREVAAGCEIVVSYRGPGPRTTIRTGWDEALNRLEAELVATQATQGRRSH